MSYYKFSALPEEYADLTYPKTWYGDGWFPMKEDKLFPADLSLVNDEDDEDDEVAHPIIAKIEEGHKITHVRVCDMWRDDHETCFNVVLTLDNGEKYGLSCWWIASECLVEFFDSAVNCDTLTNYLTE